MNRRNFISLMTLGAVPQAPSKTEKRLLIEMFDRAGIDFNEYQKDRLSIVVDGSTVTGYNNNACEFVFEKGRLVSIGLFTADDIKRQPSDYR